MNRIGKIQDKLNKTGIDLLVLREQGNVIYALNWDSPLTGILLIPKSGEAKLITSLLESINLPNSIDGVKIIKIGRGERLLQGFLKEVEKNLKYVEFDSLEMSDARRIEEELGVLVKTRSRIVSEMRVIKDQYEVEKLKKAAEIANLTVKEVFEELEEGVSEIEIACKYNRSIVLKGASKPAFETIVAFGENSSNPHFTPSSRRLRKGEIVLLDAGADYLNYKSDMTRTIVFKEDGRREIIKRMIEAVEESKKAIEKKVFPGVKAYELDKHACEILAEYDFDKYFVHGLGHGVGIDIHEPPSITPSSTEELKAGNVITIEPGIYVPGVGGVRIEDTYLITDAGPIRLTS
ncbi:MAG: Xaa-Pro peptidase family protein [Nitrososphaerota archaeon]|nr:Xaa-Pro peptidase family protein [Nitrososphaerota archaeon]